MRIAHLSDPHLGPVPRPGLGALLSKRAFGYINWLRNRGASLNGAMLDTLIADLEAQRPDHICVTGDLVNIALPEEYENAARFLERLGKAHDVTVIPGNHDAYVPGGAARAAAAWSAYMSGDDGVQRFPFMRRRGPVALIGVSTAIATVPLSARGKVGPRQLAALQTMLDKADDAYKIVMIHHPPDTALAHGHRGLVDHEAVRTVLAEGCADLILHGHNHTASEAELVTARGVAPIIGVQSASSDGSHHPIAGYGLVDFDEKDGSVRLTRRIAKAPGGRFRTMLSLDLTATAGAQAR